MHVANSPEILNKLLCGRPVRLALGNFDGVHLGHRALISRLVKSASEHGEACVVVTFSPHPAQFFGSKSDFGKIDSPRVRHRILAGLGVAGLLELTFDQSLANMTGEEFIRDVLARLPLRDVSVGRDFRFGKNRSGDVELLESFGRGHGFRVSIIDPVSVDGETASSSRIRSHIVSNGDVAGAAKILGRPFCLEGTVVKGDQIGRTIGFPTANLSTIRQIIPKDGVYAGSLMVVNDVSAQMRPSDLMPCVINIGVRPTVSSGLPERRVEAHIYDVNGSGVNLYDEIVEIQFLKRLRDEKRFESLEALKAQIAKDIADAKSC